MKTILTTLFFLCTFYTHAQEQVNLIWAKQLGGKLDDNRLFMKTDKSGNILLAGVFGDTVDFDLGPGVFNLVSAGASDIFIAKYNNQGNLIWAKQMNTKQIYELPINITVDNNENIYLAGKFLDSIDCDLGVGTAYVYSKVLQGNLSFGINGYFILKMDKNGNFKIASNIIKISSFAIDDSFNIYCVGSFADGDDLDPGPGTAILNAPQGGKSGAYILKLDSLGKFKWVKSFDSKPVFTFSSVNFYSIGLSNDNSILISGSSTGFDNIKYIEKGTNHKISSQNFMLKMDNLGNILFLNGLILYAHSQSGSIISSNGDLIFTEGFNTNSDFDPGINFYNMSASISNGSFTQDIYIYKLNSNGKFIWAKQIGGENNEKGNAIATDKMGNIYTTGNFQGRVDFNPGPSINYLQGAGSSDAYISKLDSNGKFVWAINLSGTLNEEGSGIYVDDSNYVYTVGTFNGTVDFDHGNGVKNLTSNGGIDIFLHKLEPCSQADLSMQTGGDSILANQSGASYQWYDCYFDLPIKGETKKTLKPRSSGKYSVEITMGSCIYKSDCIEFKATNTSSIEEVTQTQINIYPNPANHSAKIQSNQFIERIQIRDIQGKILQSENVQEMHYDINTSSLNNGIYFLEIINQNGQMSSSSKLNIIH